MERRSECIPVKRRSCVSHFRNDIGLMLASTKEINIVINSLQRLGITHIGRRNIVIQYVLVHALMDKDIAGAGL